MGSSKGKPAQRKSHLHTWSCRHAIYEIPYSRNLRFFCLDFPMPSESECFSAALFLEEPFGHFGSVTATGHAAVYLPRICADSPFSLRRCNPEELGVVLSRYNGIAGYDWMAVPLIPYLYSVEKSDEIPLFANGKLVAFLRNQYRRKFLEAVAPDAENGEPPTGNRVQLVGAAYDRTIYSYQIETSEEQDDALIRVLNSHANQSHFRLLSRNCADFAREILNFYYPKTLHRSIVADLGITTPKQLAKTLVRYGNRNPDLQFSSFVIPQVPGSVSRSTPVYGVLESFLKSKKYFLPLVALHPIITSGMAVAYLGTGRFDPKKQTLVLDSTAQLNPPIASRQRRDYSDQLNSMLRQLNVSGVRSTLDAGRDEFPWTEVLGNINAKEWAQLQAKAEPGLDSLGRPILEVPIGAHVVDVGLSRDNILSSPDPTGLAQEVLASRLRSELRRSTADKTAESDVISDWNLLRQAAPTASGSN
jgi:hypothetical protein